MSGIVPGSGVVLQVGGLELTVLITVVATAFLALAVAFLVAIALAPHLSAEWAERLGAIEWELEDDAGAGGAA